MMSLKVPETELTSGHDLTQVLMFPFPHLLALLLCASCILKQPCHTW
jgi:hypothetical protein